MEETYMTKLETEHLFIHFLSSEEYEQLEPIKEQFCLLLGDDFNLFLGRVSLGGYEFYDIKIDHDNMSVTVIFQIEDWDKQALAEAIKNGFAHYRYDNRQNVCGLMAIIQEKLPPKHYLYEVMEKVKMNEDGTLVSRYTKDFIQIS